MMIIIGETRVEEDRDGLVSVEQSGDKNIV